MTKEVVESAPAGASQVIVSGTPVGDGAPTAQGKAAADRDHAAEAQKVEQSNVLADRLADSGLGYWDDNIANKRYIAKLEPGAKVTPLGTPTHQLNRLLWPDDDSARRGGLVGIHVMRDDGSFFSVPPGVTSLFEITDPVSGEALIGDVDPKRAKARKAEAEGVEEKAGEPRKAKK